MGLGTPPSKNKKEKKKESTGLMMMTRGHKNHVNRVHLVLVVASLFICVVIILITVKTRKYFCLTLRAFFFKHPCVSPDNIPPS